MDCRGSYPDEELTALIQVRLGTDMIIKLIRDGESEENTGKLNPNSVRTEQSLKFTFKILAKV